MHSVTDRQTDGRQDDANSRSYCVAVRSAKNESPKLGYFKLLNTATLVESASGTHKFAPPMTRKNTVTSTIGLCRVSYALVVQCAYVTMSCMIRNEI